jgi:hypothetical protein
MLALPKGFVSRYTFHHVKSSLPLRTLSTTPTSSVKETGRDYQYFDNFEIKDGVGLSKIPSLSPSLASLFCTPSPSSIQWSK